MVEKRTGLIIKKKEISDELVLIGVQLYEEVKEVQFQVSPFKARHYRVGQRVKVSWDNNGYLLDEIYGEGA